MRRTKPTRICRRTNNLRAVQLVLGHTKLESTVRHLGIAVDDALAIAEHTEVSSCRPCRDHRFRPSQAGQKGSRYAPAARGQPNPDFMPLALGQASG